MSDEVMRFQINAQATEIAALNKKLEMLEKSFNDRETDRQSEERRKLRSAMLFLGSIIVTLGGVIWNFRGEIFRGTQ